MERNEKGQSDRERQAKRKNEKQRVRENRETGRERDTSEQWTPLKRPTQTSRTKRTKIERVRHADKAGQTERSTYKQIPMHTEIQ